VGFIHHLKEYFAKIQQLSCRMSHSVLWI